MKWKKWKAGLFVSACMGLLTGIIGWAVDLTVKQLIILLAVSVAKDVLLYLKDHKVEDALEDDPSTKPGAGPVALLALLLPLLFVGCGTLDPAGAYKGDKVLYVADQTIVGAYDALHAFVKWEFQNRDELSDDTEVTEAADAVRLGAKRWISSAIALRDVYAAQPTAENRDRLNAAIAVLKQALTEAAQYMSRPPPTPD